MNGTVAPPSSSSTAALTCRTATPSSSAIRWSTDLAWFCPWFCPWFCAWFCVTRALCQRSAGVLAALPGGVPLDGYPVGTDPGDVGELQLGPLGPVEQALSAAQDQREDHQPVLVDQAEIGQRAHQRGAAADKNVTFVGVFELFRRRGVIEDRRVLPGRIGQGGGDDVLRHTVHLVGEPEGVLHGRPSLGAALIGNPAQR